MNIYKNFDKKNLENKKIITSFSKPLNKKERDFLKFLFTECGIEEKLKKSNNCYEIDLEKILKFLKYNKIEQLQKFLNNLQNKKINFSILKDKKHIIDGSFPVLVSYNLVYSKIDFIFAQELHFSKKENNLFSILRVDFLIFMGEEEFYNFYTYLIASDYRNNIEISLPQLKELFGVEEKYERFFDFEKKILKKAVEYINLYSDIIVNYEKVKIGEFKNNKVEKIVFTIQNKTRVGDSIKNTRLTENINIIMNTVKNDVTDYYNTQELIKSYILKRGYEYVYNNVMFVKKNFKGDFEKNLRKTLLLDFAQTFKANTEKEIINIRKKYSTPFFLQLDISTLLRDYKLENELKELLREGTLQRLLTLKDEEIYEKKFENFRMFVQYFSNEESIIKIWI